MPPGKVLRAIKRRSTDEINGRGRSDRIHSPGESTLLFLSSDYRSTAGDNLRARAGWDFVFQIRGGINSARSGNGDDYCDERDCGLVDHDLDGRDEYCRSGFDKRRACEY